MTSGAVWKVILRFAFPLLIGNLLQQLYNVTDSVIVGQFLGKESLAAVSASFFIYYFIISLVIGIGSGTSVVISQFFGAKEFDKVQKARPRRRDGSCAGCSRRFPCPHRRGR